MSNKSPNLVTLIVRGYAVVEERPLMKVTQSVLKFKHFESRSVANLINILRSKITTNYGKFVVSTSLES